MANPRPILRSDGPYRFVALLGASMVLFSVAGEPSVHAGFALAGLLLWLLGVARLLLQIGQHPLFPDAFEAAAASLAVKKLKHFLFGRQEAPALA